MGCKTTWDTTRAHTHTHTKITWHSVTARSSRLMLNVLCMQFLQKAGAICEGEVTTCITSWILTHNFTYCAWSTTWSIYRDQEPFFKKFSAHSIHSLNELNQLQTHFSVLSVVSCSELKYWKPLSGHMFSVANNNYILYNNCSLVHWQFVFPLWVEWIGPSPVWVSNCL